MGNYHHDAVVAMLTLTPNTSPPDVQAFRDAMPDGLARLVIGPVESAVGGFLTYAFMPDGSKEGWDTSNEADAWRDRFVQLFQGHFCDVLRATFGGDLDDTVRAHVEQFDDEPTEE